jgi:hypothetical protein
MGQQGWDFTDAKKVLNAMGAASIADGTIYAQLRIGKQGKWHRCPPAPLTEEQVKQLEKARAK